MRLFVKGAAVASALALGLFPVLNGSANAAVDTPAAAPVVAKAPPPTGTVYWRVPLRDCNNSPVERYGQASECVRLLKHLANCHAAHHPNRSYWPLMARDNVYGAELVRNVQSIKMEYNASYSPNVSTNGREAGPHVWGGAATPNQGVYHHWNGIYSRSC